MKINLGCCDKHLPGYTNVDRVPPADQIVNLAEVWPWADSSVSEIVAHDIIEHLPDKILTMNEMWRVLMPGGIARIMVPTTDGAGAWQDPTHVSFWNRNSMFYFTAGDPHRERFGRHYGIDARFKVAYEDTHAWAPPYPGLLVKILEIHLEAVK